MTSIPPNSNGMERFAKLNSSTRKPLARFSKSFNRSSTLKKKPSNHDWTNQKQTFGQGPRLTEGLSSCRASLQDFISLHISPKWSVRIYISARVWTCCRLAEQQFRSSQKIWPNIDDAIRLNWQMKPMMICTLLERLIFGVMIRQRSRFRRIDMQ